MSHTTKVSTVPIKDISALQSAVQELKDQGINCELVENQQPRMYYRDQSGKCDYVLKLHDTKYDVGFEKQEDGSYAPIFDEWNNYVGSQIGNKYVAAENNDSVRQAKIGKLMQAYTKNAAINQATAQGYMVSNSYTDNDGNIQLEITV